MEHAGIEKSAAKRRASKNLMKARTIFSTGVVFAWPLILGMRWRHRYNAPPSAPDDTVWQQKRTAREGLSVVWQAAGLPLLAAELSCGGAEIDPEGLAGAASRQGSS